MMQVINDLAYTRLSGTENDEVKCKAYLLDKFKAFGVEPVTEPVPWSTFSTNVLIKLVVTVIFCGLVAGLVFEWLGWALVNLFFIIGIIGSLLFAIGAQQSKIDSFATMGKQQQTYNIYSQVPSKDEGEKPSRNIIFMAHHDTKTQKVTTIVRTVSYVLALFASLVMGLVFIISSIAKIAGAPSASVSWVWPMLIVIFIANMPFLVILIVNKSIEGTSLGSLDNATGMAIVLKLLEHYVEKPIANCNIWFLITGAEEWGMDGAIAFRKSKQLDPAKTFVFNFDMVAQGLNYVAKFGLPKGKPYNKRLNDLFTSAARDLGIQVDGFWIPLLGTTDGYIFKVHGYETIDIITMKTAKYTHSKKDTPAVCDAKTMQGAVEVTVKTVEKLVSE